MNLLAKMEGVRDVECTDQNKMLFTTVLHSGLRIYAEKELGRLYDLDVVDDSKETAFFSHNKTDAHLNS